MPKRHPHDEVRKKLKAFALGYPGAEPKSPWPGHDDVAVRGKTFLYLNSAGEPLSLSAKLPLTGKMVLTLPNAQPTGYGLGKSGWVSVTFDARARPDFEHLKAWADESYRAQAPKKLAAQLPLKPPADSPRPDRRKNPSKPQPAPSRRAGAANRTGGR